MKDMTAPHPLHHPVSGPPTQEDADQAEQRNSDPTADAIEMLKAVVDGRTYASVAVDFGITRTAVERRVKALARQLTQSVGIEGLNESGTAFAHHLRRNRDAIKAALTSYVPPERSMQRDLRVVSPPELTQALALIRARSSRPAHDQALFCMLFATGARALEIARLEVRDYLQPDGSVRRQSEVRPEVAINRKSRPMHFRSSVLDAALDAYLGERVAAQLGMAEPVFYRGLHPHSRLFLSATGEPFPITTYGAAGQQRHLCRAILEAYRKLFRYADLRHITSLSSRRTVAARLYERGANEDQVGLVLGISQRCAVRDLMPRRRPTLAELLHELV